MTSNDKVKTMHEVSMLDCSREKHRDKPGMVIHHADLRSAWATWQDPDSNKKNRNKYTVVQLVGEKYPTTCYP